jgi:hypothetical protein
MKVIDELPVYVVHGNWPLMHVEQDCFRTICGLEFTASRIRTNEKPDDGQICAKCAVSTPKPTGIGLIHQERVRQIEQEKFDLQHDRQHCNGEMAVAAACYAVEGIGGITLENTHSIFNNQRGWPWRPEWDKRAKHDRIRQLTISGALIAAEIDRLQTAQVCE